MTWPTTSLTRGSEDWFLSLADMTATAIFVFRDRFLWVNRASEQLSGYSAAELYQMTVWDVIHPESREQVAEQSRARRRRGEAAGSRYELKIRRKDGQERWLDFTADEIELDGRTATVGTAFDITEHKLAELALKESEERLALAQRAGRSVSWEWDPSSDLLSFSGYANELFGFPVREMIRTGEEFLRFIHPDDRDRLQRALRRALKTGGNLSVEVRCLPPNGSLRWLAEKALAIRNESGWTTKMIGVAQDITERKISEESLFQEKERALVTLASIADGVIRTDADGTIDYLNPVAQHLTGWTLAEAYGRPVSEVYRVVDQATGDESSNPVERCLREQRSIVFPGDRQLVRRDGVKYAINDSAAPIRNREGVLIGAILVFKDLTRLREVEREMVRLASRDPVTGLINRREFENRTRHALRTARSENRSHALCYMDLDQFKLVNDTCGHAAGDQMIVQIAAILGSGLAESDLLARLGGDEFGILMHDRELGDARARVEAMVESVSRNRFSWQDRIYSIGVSTGLVPITADSPNLVSLLSSADAACAVAKERGGKRVHEYEPGDTALAERHGQMQWISRIHQAFDERRFSVYQQRIEALGQKLPDSSICELFIRLHDEPEQIIEAAAFIPAAEKYGLISDIDRWMVRSALDQLSLPAVSAVRPRLHFAINLSGQSLSEEPFLDYVVEEFARTGVEPERVHFEITETSAIADLPEAIRFISVLRSMGCRFVLDDFGKGLSSFSYLQNLPVDYLKIDGEFVRNLTSDPIQAALVSSIHGIGKVMGLLTIAEAVEDRETLEALARIGVDYVQGNLVSRPRPLDSVAEATPASTPKS